MDKSPHLTPLDSPATYGRGLERKCLFVIDNGMRASLFSGGITTKTDIETKGIDDAPMIRVPSNKPQHLGWTFYFLFLCVKDKQ
jgi:hypothetical protein